MGDNFTHISQARISAPPAMIRACQLPARLDTLGSLLQVHQQAQHTKGLQQMHDNHLLAYGHVRHAFPKGGVRSRLSDLSHPTWDPAQCENDWEAAAGVVG